MEERTRQQVKAVALGAAAALLFARAILGPGVDVRHVLGVLAAAALTIPFSWVVISRAGDAAERRERIGDLGRFYVVAFLLFVLAGAGLRAMEGGRVSIGLRFTLLVPSVLAGYVLGFRAIYRPALARFKDIWVRDLSEEERKELESLQEDE